MTWDPDNDGDDDSSPFTDTDHDFWNADGTPIAAAWKKAGKPCPPAVDMKGGGMKGGMRQELTISLALEATGGKTSIVQEASADNGGVMRFRTPFYVGGSVTRAKGFSKPILFQESILPNIITKGQARISSGRPPLTVYARHAHSDTKDHLPIGKVTALEQEGRIGYATLDILDVKPFGEHTQALIRAEMLDSVSLRCEPGSYQLEARRVDGVPMLVCESLDVDGIDMAPDGPAQDTYGFKVLTQEAVITNDEPVTPHKETSSVGDEALTLEAVRANTRVLEEIERPLKDQISGLTQERDVLLQEKSLRERDATIEEIAAKAGNPTEFAAHVRQVCDAQGVKDKGGVNALLAPILLQEMERMKTAQPSAESDADKTARLFRVGGAGQVGEGAVPPPIALERAFVSLNGTVDGGLVPED